MTKPKKTKTKRRARPLYHSAKISDYRFKKVLWHFVRDHTTAETAKGTGLSVNSVQAIFRKIRVYFYEVGLFQDICEGKDPHEGDTSEPVFGRALQAFHSRRHSAKRGLNAPDNQPDYYFAESYWRYDYHITERERTSEALHDMMLAHLLEIIHACGPIGTKPENQHAGLLAILRQMDQRVTWLSRNAADFKHPTIQTQRREFEESP